MVLQVCRFQHHFQQTTGQARLVHHVMPSQDLRQASFDDVRDRLVGREDVILLPVAVATVQCMVTNVMVAIEMVTEAMHTAVAVHLDAARA